MASLNFPVLNPDKNLLEATVHDEVLCLLDQLVNQFFSKTLKVWNVKSKKRKHENLKTEKLDDELEFKRKMFPDLGIYSFYDTINEEQQISMDDLLKMKSVFEVERKIKSLSSGSKYKTEEGLGQFMTWLHIFKKEYFGAITDRDW